MEVLESVDLQKSGSGHFSQSGHGLEVKRLRDLPDRCYNDSMRAHCNLAVKLSDIAGEFVQKLSSVQEQHSQHLSQLARDFRKKSNEKLKKDSLFSAGTEFCAWECLLDETEREAKMSSELAYNLLSGVQKDLLDMTNRKKQILKRWFAFRETYMSWVDKTEDQVQKTFKDYSDQWTKYAEAIEKGTESVKDSVILHSYNSHNDYVLQVESFNGLHEEFYGKQVFDLLDELQALYEETVRGFATALQRYSKLCQDKANQSLQSSACLQEAASQINAPADLSVFVAGQNMSGSRHFPPPKASVKSPDLPPPKLPDSAPVDLPPLSPNLQLVDMTQAPLMNAQETLKQRDFELGSEIERLQTEYKSVKGLLDSYRGNPSMGDPETLMDELLEMRNKIRMKKSELVMIKRKLALFTTISTGNGVDSSYQHHSPNTNSVDNHFANSSMAALLPGRPRISSTSFVQGKSHEFCESSHKLPVLCAYCDGLIQPMIQKGLRCKVCKMNVHPKCQNYMPYCSGVAPVKQPPKFKVPKRISMILQRRSLADISPSIEEDEDASDNTSSPYEVPSPAIPNRKRKAVKQKSTSSPNVTSPTGSSSPTSQTSQTNDEPPLPPKRGESLASTRNNLSDSFEDSLNLIDQCNYCVMLYDYAKVNPNDIDVRGGEVVELVNTASSDWWKGRVGERKGYFPASYAQPLSPGETVMVALYDFTPSSHSEMRLMEGQIVVMSRDDGDGWLFGHSGEEEGLFPQNYVKNVSK